MKTGVPVGSVVKSPPASAGVAGSVPGSGRSLEKEKLQYSGLENPWTEEPSVESTGLQKGQIRLSD